MSEAPSSNAPLEDFSGFFEELKAETPRAGVIISAAFLDGWLRRLLAASLIDDKAAVDRLLGTEDDSDRPLGTFAARARAAYCLGLIDKTTHEDLAIIRRIRNRFAHAQHGLTFDDPKIVALCMSLQFATKVIKGVPSFPSDHGSRFVLAVTVISSKLQVTALAAEKKRAPRVSK